MNVKSLIVAVGVMAVLILGQANTVEARGFGMRGTSIRIGIGGSSNRAVRYNGPSFYTAPRSYGTYRQGSTQFQQRPWYSYRSGPYTYYRPYNPLYRTR